MADPLKPGWLTSEFTASLVPYALSLAVYFTPMIEAIPNASPDVKTVCKACVVVVGLVIGAVKGIAYNSGRVEVKKAAIEKGA